MGHKAKFDGECQICGHVQKLPGDKLSLHGYTVRWNCFNGSCPGSRNLPFEVSKDLIQRYRDAAAASAVSCRAAAADFLAGKRDEDLTEERYYSYSDPKCPGYLKKKGGTTHERVVVSQIKVPYSDGTGSYEKTVVTYVSDGTESKFSYGKPWDVVARFRKRQADALVHTAERQESYVAWQDQRMKDWAPKQLKSAVREERATVTAGMVITVYGNPCELLRTARQHSYRRDTTGWQVRRQNDGREFFVANAQITRALKA